MCLTKSSGLLVCFLQMFWHEVAVCICSLLKHLKQYELCCRNSQHRLGREASGRPSQQVVVWGPARLAFESFSWRRINLTLSLSLRAPCASGCESAAEEDYNELLCAALSSHHVLKSALSFRPSPLSYAHTAECNNTRVTMVEQCACPWLQQSWEEKGGTLTFSDQLRSTHQ